jgi:hypothetical protein
MSKNKINKVKVVSFFDYLDRKSDEATIRHILKDVPGVIYKGTGNEQEFEDALVSNCVALVDYGGIGFSIGGSGLSEHYDIWIEELIKDRPSVRFIFCLTMGREYYPDLWNLPNVYSLDKGSNFSEELKKSITN